MTASEALTGTSPVRFPVGIFPTVESRQTKLRHVIIGVLVVAVLAEAGFSFVGGWPVTPGIVGAAILLLGAAAILWDRWKPTGTGSRARIEISPEGVRCHDLVRREAAWNVLTPFRWVQSEDIKRGTVFNRSDGRSSSNLMKEEGFVIEAAGLGDPSSTNEFGYYDNPAIQFDVDDLCVGGVTRAKVDEFVNWLNVLQLSAVQGRLADLDTIQVPMWLNAASVERFPQGSTTPSANLPVVRQ